MNIFELNSNCKWITTNRKLNNISCFKKSFDIKEKLIKSTLYICGLGYYEATINGVKFDNHYFKPNVSDYCKRNDPLLIKKTTYFAYYNTFDVTKFLKDGENVLDVYVAPGLFHNVDKMDAPNYDYGKTRLIFIIANEYKKGVEYIYSDSSTLCAVSNSSSRVFRGDYINFQKRNLAYFNATELKSNINLREAKFSNDIIAKTYQPSTIIDSPRNKIFDFGLNHTGGIKCHIKGKKGTIVTVKYSEFTNPDGSLNFMSSAYSDFKEEEFVPPFYSCKANKYPVIQKNTYILSGDIDYIEPLFSYRCYRYIQIECNNDIEIIDLESAFIHSDIKQISTFESSSKMLNHFYNCYIQTQFCNLHSGLTTDCPHREKIAYTGDGQIVSEALLRNFDAVSFFDKWLDDVIASQGIDGYVPNSAPDMAGGGGHFWGYAITAIPLNIYKMTGDKSFLTRSYNAMFKWIKYLSKTRGENGLLTSNGLRWFLGDWLAPEPIKSDTIYVNTIAFCLSIENFLKVNKILGNPEDLQLIHLLEKTKIAINEHYFNKDTFSYSSDNQGETLLALYADVVEPQYLSQVRNSFINKYKENDYHIDTGIVCTPILFEMLSKLSSDDIALRLLIQQDYPSFAYMLKNETTYPEHWSKKWIAYKQNDDGEAILEPTGDVSHCHPMFGAIVPWIQTHIGGIDISHIAKHEVLFAPNFVRQVRACKSSYKDIFFSYSALDELTFEIKMPKYYEGVLLVPNLSNKTYRITNLDTKESFVASLPYRFSEGHYLIKEIIE